MATEKKNEPRVCITPIPEGLPSADASIEDFVDAIMKMEKPFRPQHFGINAPDSKKTAIYKKTLKAIEFLMQNQFCSARKMVVEEDPEKAEVVVFEAKPEARDYWLGDGLKNRSNQQKLDGWKTLQVLVGDDKPDQE